MTTNEIKNCPYCGEEILAVAKKCKHCGEWLENKPLNNRIGLFKNADYTGMLPVSTILFCLNAWLGISAPLCILHTLIWGFGTIFISWFLSLGLAVLLIWTGLKRSQYLTDQNETTSTLRTWLAIQIALAWWPLNVIICLLLGLGIFTEDYSRLGGYSEYPVYMIVSWVLMIVIGIIFYLKSKRKDCKSVNEIAKPFVLTSLIETGLIFLFLYILRFDIRFVLPIY